MYIIMQKFRKVTLIAFGVLVLSSLSLIVSCSKEVGLSPANVQENPVPKEVKNFKSDEYLTFDRVKMMIEGKGTLIKTPLGYRSFYPPSEKYEIWLFSETLTGKIYEIYVYKDLETMKQIANQVCNKKFFNSGGQICCEEPGSSCYTEVDECGNVCIILCLA
ncbi:MAG: hypothetical protein KatS3mg035_0476 [Bacteroidia bacterium]|nr:MAG: hypothetical protein KatS3mg035_0476 [Bacteroidia bacterium]